MTARLLTCFGASEPVHMSGGPSRGDCVDGAPRSWTPRAEEAAGHPERPGGGVPWGGGRPAAGGRGQDLDLRLCGQRPQPYSRESLTWKPAPTGGPLPLLSRLPSLASRCARSRVLAATCCSVEGGKHKQVCPPGSKALGRGLASVTAIPRGCSPGSRDAASPPVGC